MFNPCISLKLWSIFECKIITYKDHFRCFNSLKYTLTKDADVGYFKMYCDHGFVVFFL